MSRRSRTLSTKSSPLDLRNHGRSPHSDILDYDVMVADVREFMEQQARCVASMLLGHSLGGKAVMQFAIDYSEQVDRLVIVDYTRRSPTNPLSAIY